MQNDQRWLPLLSWVFIIFRGRTLDPLSKVCCIYIPTLLNTRLVEKSEVYNSRSEHAHQWGSASIICDLLAKDLLYPLSVKYRGGKDQDPVKMLENSMLVCSLFLLEFQ